MSASERAKLRTTVASRWYQWSVRVLEARLALRRGDASKALAIRGEIARADDAPPIYALQAELIAVEALLALGQIESAEQRLDSVARRVEPGTMSGTWGEFLRLRGRLHAAAGRATEAYHDFGQSVSVFDLLGERYQAGPQLSRARPAGRRGRRPLACDPLSDRTRRDLRVARRRARSGETRRPRSSRCRR